MSAGVAAARAPRELAALADDALLDEVQRQTWRFFWEGAHPVSGLAPDRRTRHGPDQDELVAVGGSGFGLLALVVATERGWIAREAALQRLESMLAVLERATCYHGAWPHFMHGRTGVTLPFSRKDDGGDLVETSLAYLGLLCARQYFTDPATRERRIRERIGWLYEEVEWSWYTQGRKVLYWHWSPTNGWALDQEIRGWNECLITYVLAAGAPRYPIDPLVYHRGFAGGREFLNGRPYYSIELPLGMPYGGPLFIAQYSFCGLDPRGLRDRYADYWQQNVHHVRINHAHCVANPNGHRGLSDACWGLTASDDPAGYAAHAPDQDNGTISPTAALSSFPYAPAEAMRALRHFLSAHGERIWDRFGFIDAFCESQDWFADTYLAIDQGPIIAMIENYRTGLLWRLFMSAPEVQLGLRRLDFVSPQLPATRP